MLRIVLFIFALCSSAAFVQAQSLDDIVQKAAECREYSEQRLGWTIPPWDCRQEPALSLSKALEYNAEFMGASDDNKGLDNPACVSLLRVGFPTCSFNVRLILVQFLSLYGVDLFPAENVDFFSPSPTSYSGKAEENSVLIIAIERNAHLFTDGDLTAEEVQQWR